MSRPPLIVYHASCSDGAGAAFAAWCKYGEDAEYRAARHGETLSAEDVQDRQVFLLDFSYSRAECERIAESKPLAVRIFDHHLSTEREFAGLLHDKDFWGYLPNMVPFSVVVDKERSGAVLAWEWFHGTRFCGNSDPHPVPEILRYIEDRDLWRWTLPRSREVSAALESRGVRENFRKLVLLFSDDVFRMGVDVSSRSGIVGGIQALADEGEAILRARDQQVAVVLAEAEEIRFPHDGRDHLVWAANSPLLQSEIGAALAERSGTFGAVWHRDGRSGQFKVSLRSVGVCDVSEIAERLGGGGHMHASSFRCERLPWSKGEKDSTK